MAFNISRFSAEVRANGLLRTNKFRVRFGAPPGLIGQLGTTSTMRTIELWCSSTTLPGLLVAPGESRRYGYGPSTKNPVAPIYPEVGFTVIADAKGKTWNFFNSWMRLVLNHDGFGETAAGGGSSSGVQDRSGPLPDQHPWELGYLDEVSSDIDVVVFDNQGKEALSVVLRSAWPFSLGSVNLSWEDRNNYIKLPVQFNYSDWHSRPLNP